MLDIIWNMFDTASFMPRNCCVPEGEFPSTLRSILEITDLVIFGCYLGISLILIVYIKKNKLIRSKKF